MSFEDCIDVVQEWADERFLQPPIFVDRGDPAGDDFSHITLAQDGNWHDLDLSAIVPAGATAILFRLLLLNTNINKTGRFRKAGNVNTANISEATTQVANQIFSGDFTCPVDENRHIEYRFTILGWNLILLTIKGWWL